MSHALVSPAVFLALATAAAMAAWGSLTPIRRPWPLMLASFFVGLLVSEFPLHHHAIQALVSAVFVHEGASRSAMGVAALLAMVLSWVGLVQHHRLARRARAILDRELASMGTTAPRMRTSLLVLPLPIRHPDVERVGGIPFHRDEHVDLRLNLYRHRSRPTRCPTLVFVHGGAWIAGPKGAQGLPLMHQLAALGWVCVSIDYRLSPKATFPDHIVDVKRAIRWVREHGAENGADPSFIVIAGDSAGGHLASLAALTSGEVAWQPGFEDVDCSVQGCISMYGVYDLLDRSGPRPRDWTRGLLRYLVMKTSASRDTGAWDRASPIQRITAGAPPFLVVHGDCDSVVPLDQARQFRDAFCATACAPLYYAELPGAQHGFDAFPSVRSAAFVHAAARFAQDLHARHAAAGEAARISA